MLAYNTWGLKEEHLPLPAVIPITGGVSMYTETVGEQEAAQWQGCGAHILVGDEGTFSSPNANQQPRMQGDQGDLWTLTKTWSSGNRSQWHGQGNEGHGHSSGRQEESASVAIWEISYIDQITKLRTLANTWRIIRAKFLTREKGFINTEKLSLERTLRCWLELEVSI